MFNLPKLSYNYNELEPYIDEETMKLHYEKHHATYIKNLNNLLSNYPELIKLEIDQLILNSEKIPERDRQKIMNNAGQHYNHTLFWEILIIGKIKNSPEGEINEVIERFFTSFENLQNEFQNKALALFGSGWIFLTINNKVLEIITLPNGETPLLLGKEPILALDLWEHAYYLKYKNLRSEYVNNFWQIINWKRVNELYINKIK